MRCHTWVGGGGDRLIVTEEGRDELVRRLDSQIRDPQREFSQFLGAVTYLGALGTDGAVEAPAERVRRLQQRTAADEDRLAEALAAGVPRLYVIEAEYALCLARAETAGAASVIDDLRTGSLTWPTDTATTSTPSTPSAPSAPSATPNRKGSNA
ncbi:hypothetical protein ACIQWR_11270 [Streptomyces sp. NPDC098789]|uniref:hypothetical protein n=1 Tax=Streptomyces sp. NPDC098789 TaxID=3366098 RepID=UPI0038079AD1